ncbi:MAG: arabinogalactan endo-1,4-beta-galactosidase [Bacteroidales bacterium]|nr:arabinogalactan endo-1,4-beta-galactosidase [Bacteroidales bacterium]
MKRLNIFLLAAMLMMAVLPSCGDDDNNDPAEDPDNGTAEELAFAYGADPSWVTEMESKGIKFYDNDGNETECLTLLKSIGFNAARFRVWVDPSSANGYGAGWCGKADVVAKAKRASDLGYKIMIDFHYSDNWADPGKQWKPKAWDNLATIDELAQAAADHTKDVLSALKEEGIDVMWVQIGNETTNGMMTAQSDQSEATLNCSLSSSCDNYVKVHNKAREAAKEVYSNCKIVIHFDRGHNWDKFSWGIDKLIKGGAEFDIFGLSIYPVVTASNWYSTYVDAVINNMNKFVETYGKDVMICETGCENIGSYNAKRAINDIVVRARQEVKNCKGVFYWEPECNSSWGYKMGGFLSNGRPSEALNVFNGKATELMPEEAPSDVELVAENLYVYIDGVVAATCVPDENGIWRGTVTTTAEWQNFTAKDGKGNKYAVKDWNTWNSFVKASGEFDHFWFAGDMSEPGTYDIWFDPNTSTWGGAAATE